jgi:hypothetical protein
LLDQELDDLGAEEFFQGLERGFGEGEEVEGGELKVNPLLAVRRVIGGRDKQAVGYESVNVRVEVEVFAEGVEGENDAGHAFGAGQGDAQVIGEALLGETAEVLEQEAMAQKIRTEHFWNSQDVVAMGHGSHYVIQDVAGGGLDISR